MCIICNCNKDKPGQMFGSDFLNEFSAAQFYLKKAEKSLLMCSMVDKRYNPKPKQLVKLRKQLNRWFTEQRENHGK